MSARDFLLSGIHRDQKDPVVSRDWPRKMVGYLGRAAVMMARLHRHHKEHEREPRWLQGLA